jgi:hypothetical protein
MNPLAALSFAKPFLGILTFGVTLPVWLFLVGGLWLYFDRGSDIRQAVDRAVKEVVAGAELEAARAAAEAERMIAAAQRGRAEALAAANRNMADGLATAQEELEEANGQIADLLSRPVDGECTVDDDVFGRLRSK